MYNNNNNIINFNCDIKRNHEIHIYQTRQVENVYGETTRTRLATDIKQCNINKYK